MAWYDDLFEHVPEYDHYMYLRGYTPEEIMYAHRKKSLKQIEERLQQIQKQKQEEQLEKEIEKQTMSIVKKTIDELLEGLNK